MTIMDWFNSQSTGAKVAIVGLPLLAIAGGIYMVTREKAAPALKANKRRKARRKHGRKHMLRNGVIMKFGAKSAPLGRDQMAKLVAALPPRLRAAKRKKGRSIYQFPEPSMSMRHHRA